jgi:demethylmenaquinone methyltransferase/2-methoxy-6-polyprenyl-1,4-benzoquinol methylase
MSCPALMPNAYYQPGSERAAEVNRLFADIAPRYDRINDLQSFGLHHRWKDRLVALAGLKPENRALDVCCGTGDITERLAATGAEAVGLDFTNEMLEVARARARRPEIQDVKSGSGFRITYQQGDAMNLPFAEDTFDAVTVGFGLRNLSEWDQGLREMHRVARPGGRLLVLDFGRPDNALWRWLYFAYLRVIVPVYGKLFCGNWSAYAYILESLKAYPAQRGVERAMHEMNCRDVRVLNFFGGAMSINYGVKSPP